jgi:hypothetical protein
VVKPAYVKPEYKTAMEGKSGKNAPPGHKKKYGFNQGNPKLQDKTGYTRNFPKDVPGSKAMRFLGWSHHGKTGLALTGAAAVAGGVAGAKKAGDRYDKKHPHKKRGHVHRDDENVKKYMANPFGVEGHPVR